MHKYPDFYIIGAAKSGTTTLYHLLRQNKNIFMPELKEPCYFDEDVNWKNGADWYLSLFKEAEKNQICGEASTNYTRWPQVKGVPTKIHKYSPDAKLIYILRDPVRRAFSHYVHRWTKEVNPTLPFNENFISYIKNDPICIDSSKYYLQLTQYLKFFPKHQIYLILFEDLIEDPLKVCENVFSFLGVSATDIDSISKIKFNVNEEFRYYMVKDQLKEHLDSYFINRILIKTLPAFIKNIMYDSFYSKTKFAKSMRAKFDPDPLTEADTRTVYNMLKEDIDLLKNQFQINTNHWIEF